MQNSTPPEMPGATPGKILLNLGLLCLAAAVLAGLWVLSQNKELLVKAPEQVVAAPDLKARHAANAARFFTALPFADEGWTRQDLPQTAAVNKILAKFDPEHSNPAQQTPIALEHSKLGVLYTRGSTQVMIVQSQGYPLPSKQLSPLSLGGMAFDGDTRDPNALFARMTLEPERHLLIYANRPPRDVDPFLQALDIRKLSSALPGLPGEVVPARSQ